MAQTVARLIGAARDIPAADWDRLAGLVAAGRLGGVVVPPGAAPSREALARTLAARAVQRRLGAGHLHLFRAEDLAAQRESLRLFERIATETGGDGTFTYAMRHYAVIARFGRFPHRNAILGRASTPDELEFLRQPGSSF